MASFRIFILPFDSVQIQNLGEYTLSFCMYLYSLYWDWEKLKLGKIEHFHERRNKVCANILRFTVFQSGRSTQGAEDIKLILYHPWAIPLMKQG